MNEKEKKSRARFNLIWLVAWLVITFLFPYILPSSLSDQPEIVRLLIIFGPILSIQVFFHYLILNRKYPTLRESNLYWVIVMPILIFVMVWIIIIIFLVRALSQGPWPT